MKRAGLTALLAVLVSGVPLQANEEGESFVFPSLGGLILAPDQTTLIVAVPSHAELVYLDTLTDKEIKRVSLPFKPGCLTVQGRALVAATEGSAVLHVLDWQTGKVRSEVTIQGEPIQSLACNPQGSLYAATTANAILVIDRDRGKYVKTKARGALLTLDGKEGRFLYTGIQKPLENEVEVRGGPGGSLVIRFERTGERAMLLKYRVDGSDLELVAANANAAVLGRSLALSRDGGLVAMAGNGGWRSPKDRQPRQTIAVFQAKDLKTLAGQIDTEGIPNNIVFHPVLDVGVVETVAPKARLFTFDAKTFTEAETVATPDGVGAIGSSLLLFGGRGRKIIYADAAVRGSKERAVHFLPLPLSDREKAALEKAYPKIPGPSGR